MRKELRTNLIKVSLILFVTAVMAFLALTFNVFNVNAQTTDFVMGDGAEIFVLEDNAEYESFEDKGALRFTTTLSESYHNSLLEEFPNATLRYYTIVANTGVPVNELEYGDVKDDKSVIKIHWSEFTFTNGMYTFNTTIANIPTIGYRDVLSLRSCVRISQEGQQDIIRYAQGTDSYRSIEGVANIALLSGASFDVYGKYVGGGKVYDNATSSGYAEIGDAFIVKVPSINVKIEKPTVYVGAVPVIGATVSQDGSVAVPKGYTDDFAPNTQYVLSVMDGTNVYRTRFTAVHHVIYNEQDFNDYVDDVRSVYWLDPTAQRKGAERSVYAALGCNVTLTTPIGPGSYDGSVFNGVASGYLDGQGYSLFDLQINTYSLFEDASNFTVKNIGFIGAKSVYSSTKSQILFTYTNYLKLNIDNCYIEWTANTTNARASIVTTGSNSCITNTYCKSSAPNSSTKTVFRVYNPSPLTNFISITDSPNGLLPQPATADQTNYGCYANTTELATAISKNEIDISHFETNSCWYINSNGVPVFKSAMTDTEFVDVTIPSTSIAKNREDSLNISLESVGTFDSSQISSVKINGADVTSYTFSDNILSISSSEISSGDSKVVITIEADKIYTITAPVDVIDFMISDSQEFIDFLSVEKTDAIVYAKLANSFKFNLPNGSLDVTDFTDRDTFNFVLDGNGYTIDGIVTGCGMFTNVGTAVVKNIGFVNLIPSSDTVVSFMFYDVEKSATLENVYIQGNMRGVTSGANVIGFDLSCISLDKVVIDVEFNQDSNDYYTVSSGTAEPVSATNVYSVSTTASQSVVTGNDKFTFFGDRGAFIKQSEQLAEVLGGLWQVRNGALIFNSIVDVIDDIEIDNTISCSTFIIDGDTTSVVIGTHELSANDSNARYNILTNVKGVSLVGNILIVDSTAITGSTFTIQAISYSPVYNTKYVSQTNVVVLGDSNVYINKVMLGGKNRGTIGIDYYNDYGINLNATLNSITVNGLEVNEGSYSFYDGLLTILVEELENGANIFDIQLTYNGLTYNTNLYLEVVDYLIGTASEFVEWRNVMNSYTYTSSPVEIQQSASAKLINNVDMSGVKLTSEVASTAAVGEFDGQGFVISNLALGSVSLFNNSYNFTMKNVAFVNTTGKTYMWNQTSAGAGKTYIENCYFEFDSTHSKGQIWHIGGLLGSIKNTIIVNNVSDTQYPTIFRASIPGKVENVFAISTHKSLGTVCELNAPATAVNSGSYAVREELVAAINNKTLNTEAFNSAYWYIATDGMPVWKNIDDVFVVNGNVIVGLTTFGSSLASIDIPAKINGQIITEIANDAFSANTNLKKVTLTSNLAVIGANAFSGCTNLKEIIIPTSVSVIGANAFSGCTNLVINCDAQAKPNGWSDNWNSSNCKVVWDYSGFGMIVKNGATTYQLVVPSSTDSYLTQGINDFVKLFKESTGITLTTIFDNLVNYDESSRFIVLGVSKISYEAGVIVDDRVELNGFQISTLGNSIFVLGKTTRGSMYGAYELARMLLNYEIFTPDTYIIDKNVTNVEMPDIDSVIIDNPDIPVRIGGWGPVYANAKFENANKMQFEQNYRDLWISSSFPWTHNTADILDYVNNRDSHPEWFMVTPNSTYNAATATDNTAEAVGKMVQLCYTAHGNQAEYAEMVETAAQVLANAILKDKTGNKYVQISAEDNNRFCKCAACLESYAHYAGDACLEGKEAWNGLAGTMLKFVNLVAKRVKELAPNSDVKIATFIYSDYTNAPVYENKDGTFEPIDDSVVCPDNVVIYLAPALVTYTKDFDSVENASFMNVFKGAQAICSNFGAWLYQDIYDDYFLPFNSFYSYKGMYTSLYEAGAQWVFHQGQQTATDKNTAFGQLKLYLNSKLAWDTSLDTDELIQKFFDGYFGPASATMKAYFDDQNAHLDKLLSQGVAMMKPTLLSKNYFSKSKLNTWLSYCEQALDDIAGLEKTDPERYAQLVKNINCEAMTPKYLLIRLYSVYNGQSIGSDISLADTTTQFIEECTAAGVLVYRQHENISGIDLTPKA